MLSVYCLINTLSWEKENMKNLTAGIDVTGWIMLMRSFWKWYFRLNEVSCKKNPVSRQTFLTTFSGYVVFVRIRCTVKLLWTVSIVGSVPCWKENCVSAGLLCGELFSSGGRKGLCFMPHHCMFFYVDFVACFTVLIGLHSVTLHRVLKAL